MTHFQRRLIVRYFDACHDYSQLKKEDETAIEVLTERIRNLGATCADAGIDEEILAGICMFFVDRAKQPF